MRDHFLKNHEGNILRVISIVLGITFNTVLSYLSYQLSLPVRFDSIATVIVTSMGGLYSGIATAVLTGLLSTLFNKEAVYFGIVGVLFVILTFSLTSKKLLNKPGYIIGYIVCAGFISGISSSFVQWRLYMGEGDAYVVDTAFAMSDATGLPYIISFVFSNILVNLGDKGLCILIALLILHYIPEKIQILIRNSGWRQKPLTGEEVKLFSITEHKVRFSLRFRTMLIQLWTMLLLVVMMGFVGIRLYFENAISEKTEIARNAVIFASTLIDPDRIDEYMEIGEITPGYKETEDMLYHIRDAAAGVEYLYVFQVKEKGMTYIFDLDSGTDYEEYTAQGDEVGYDPGTFTPIDEELIPYLDDLLNGRELPAIESRTAFNWFVSTYYPVIDDSGKCVCYCGADASIDYISDYLLNFVLHVFWIMLGIIAMILTYGIRAIDYFLVFPIYGMVSRMMDLTQSVGNQSKSDEAVKKLRKLDIHTGDEIEKLYDEICSFAMHGSEAMRSIRRYSNDTLKMQDGLIMTMADMVENRDSDSLYHIQKTSAYVKIILESLYKKGYYAEKISQKYIDDVVRSAPLHDIGKIRVPDQILQKKHKLGEEENEILRAHTTAGKEILEKAIDAIGEADYLKEARNMAAYHHEHWDGNGYPEGLHGQVIPLSARVMAVADRLDTLTSVRQGKKLCTLEEALSNIKELSGSRFDPKIVEAALDAAPELEIILNKYKDMSL
ncbi:HD-GYP domain-containing protein [Butyrivibrio sp. MC2013]|uniref:HD-GYP domain-containing protein n=1 Tax=Butyrivibrio sp. MC2013 TaxID=1280686 RepID=UPI000408294E|nr:HD domain-containing phosphohydrolase [Butyrivibrio sp. MC2013]